MKQTDDTPILAAYIDMLATWSPPDAVLADILENIGDFNHLILSFWEPSGPLDVAGAWADGTFPQDSIDRLHDAGVKVLVSAGGATATPISDWLSGNGTDGKSYGEALATWALEQKLDGVDFDIEDGAYQTSTEEAIQWTVDAFRAAHETLAAQLDSPIVSAAPQAPYFDPEHFANGPYLSVDQQVGDLVSFYNIQLYNQDSTAYATYDTLFKDSGGWSADSAVAQIVANGVPLTRIVIGKPLLESDASNTGWVSADDLASWIHQASGQNLRPTGVMTWQFHSDSNSAEWSETVAKGFEP